MIFYFSATGNTRWVAFKLANALREQLFYVPDILDKDITYELAPGERLGFVFPVHGWRVPAFMRRFISRMHISSASTPYIYSICTAGDSIGDTMTYLRKAVLANSSMREMGIEDVDSAWSLIMPESYVGLPFMDVDPPEKEKRKKETAAQQLPGIIETVNNREKGINQLTIGYLPWFLSHVVGWWFEKFYVTDKLFKVTQDKCVKCGICANVCPTHDIEGGYRQLPKWKHDGSCLTCFNCYHHCPKHAIEFGCFTRKKGQYYFK